MVDAELLLVVFAHLLDEGIVGGAFLQEKKII